MSHNYRLWVGVAKTFKISYLSTLQVFLTIPAGCTLDPQDLVTL